MTTKERPREIWTRFAVDPVADLVAPWLARRRFVTPNRVTSLAFLMAIAAAASFVSGQWRLGGLCFLLRFFLDCLDGKVSRLQGSSSTCGATLDISVDVVGISLCFGAALWRLDSTDVIPSSLGIGLMGTLIIYNWSLSHRKHLAEHANLGSGGADFEKWKTRIVPLSAWLMLSRRLNMSPVPWAVEAEAVTLGIAPILLAPRHLADLLWFTLAFYMLACVVNLRRCWRISRTLDATTRKEMTAT